MKRTLLCFGLLFCASFLFAGPNRYTGIDKGTELHFKVILVSSHNVGNQVLVDSATVYPDWSLENLGPYDIWYGSSPLVKTAGSSQGAKLKVGESWSPEGKINMKGIQQIYGIIPAALTGASTVQWIPTRQDRTPTR